MRQNRARGCSTGFVQWFKPDQLSAQVGREELFENQSLRDRFTKHGWSGERGTVMKERRWADVIRGFPAFHPIMNEFHYGSAGVHDLGTRIRGARIRGGFDFVGSGQVVLMPKKKKRKAFIVWSKTIGLIVHMHFEIV